MNNDNSEKVIAILADITGVNVKDQMDENLFNSGILDSMGTVQMVMDLEDAFQVSIPVSEMVREEWDTPNKIVAKVVSLQ